MNELKIRSKYFLALWLMALVCTVHGQTAMHETEKANILKAIPKEDVFIHQNASTLFVGERLFYKMYCLDQETDLLSAISKIGYVELVGADKRSIFMHKVRLVNGTGEGDFFIPANVPTGNYKLLGYTRWMKNNPVNRYYISDVNIINLYLTDENSLETELDSTSSVQASLRGKRTNMLMQENHNEAALEITLNKEKYGKREKVVINLEALLEDSGYGSYSISVKRKDTIVDSNASDTAYHKKITKTRPSTSDFLFLPELRGELLAGQIVAKNQMSSLANRKIGFSIPGNNFIFKMANTNEKGEFYFNLDSDYENTVAYIQVFGNEKDAFQIELQENSIAYDNLEFNRLRISKTNRESILQRSIHAQIENAYFDAKDDSLVPVIKDIPFYKKFATIYNLDDYTRFPSIEETFLEIIENAWIDKNGDNDISFKVRGDEYFTDSNFQPLVIVDGIMLQNHADLLNMGAEMVKTIGISRNDYEFALQMFRGIIFIETFEGNSEKLFDRDFIGKIDLNPPLRDKRYFRPKYRSNTEMAINRVPDYRYQLLWLPELILREGEETIEFFTSDITGGFEVILRGFTSKGTPVTISRAFQVE